MPPRRCLRSLIAVLTFLLCLPATMPVAASVGSNAQSPQALRAQSSGGWVEVRIMDCAVAPVGTSVIVGAGDPVPDGFSVCVPGNTHTHDYDVLVDGAVPTYVSQTQASEFLANGNHVVTVKGGGRSEFLIRDWTVVLYAYFKGEVTGPMPPVDELPDTGAGISASGTPVERDPLLPLLLVVASVSLGYVSIRSVRAARA